MKRMFLLLSLVVLAFVVAGCAPQMTDEEADAALQTMSPEEVEAATSSEGGALAGQAYSPKARKAARALATRTWTRCSDTDGGADDVIKGRITALYQDSKGNKKQFQAEDYCKSGTELVEWFCKGNVPTKNKVFCTLGCINGVCVQPAPTPLDIEDTDGPVNESCNGLDDDRDGQVDENAWEICGAGNLCVAGLCVESACFDGVDNDNDGMADCKDQNCDGSFKEPTIRATECQYPKERNCADGFDNDGDGGVDCADADCGGVGDCPPPLSCAPGPTGRYNCTQLDRFNNSRYLWAYPFYQREDCTTYLGTRESCESDYGRCLPEYGCCWDKVISTSCSGSIMVNVSNNTCTGVLSYRNYYCNSDTWKNMTGGTFICGMKAGVAGCYERCQPGKISTACKPSPNGYVYTSYRCNDDGLGLVWNATPSTCPGNTTGNVVCQNNFCTTT